jgi:uncharacterized protein YkwD
MNFPRFPRRFAASFAAATMLTSAAYAQQQYSIGDPAPDQQFILELINRARANADAEAVRLGLPNRQEGPPMIGSEPWNIENVTQPLSWNPQLQTAAQNHAKTLNDADQFFSGQDPHTFGGTTPEQRIDATGYTRAPYTGQTTPGGAFPGAENVAVAVSQGSGPYTGAKYTAAVLNAHNSLYIDAGVQGRGHRNTTTLGWFREVGVGITTGTDQGQGVTWDSHYVVQNFGRHTNNLPFITGVVYRDANNNNFYDPGEGVGGVRVDVAGANFFAISSSSGGYSVPVPGNGTYNVTFSGSSVPTVQRTATVANLLNVKLDYLPANVQATPAALANISTRLRVETGDNVLIGGFIVTGNAPKKVIIRAIGPSLSANNIAGALQDPTLELVQGESSLRFNDNWKDTQQAEIQASTIPPSNDAESAIVATLNPGAYTAVMRGKDNSSGVGLVEIYDIDAAADSRLANIATRGSVQTGENVMIAGMIVTGQTGSSRRVVIRAVGPSLTVNGKLADPTLDLVDGNGSVVRTNDNWRTAQQAEIEATGVAPSNDLEAAVLETLVPGNYTATVRGAGGTTGVAVVEVYALTN